MSRPPEIERYTVEDYLRWEGEWELIDGIPQAMAPSPAVSHQRVAAALFRQLDEALEHCPECEVLYEIDVTLDADTVVRPDLLVTCRQPPGERLTRAPAMIVEVVSVESARRDERTKFEVYRAGGVVYYVLVYPMDRIARIYRLAEGEYRKVADVSGARQDFDLPAWRVEIDFARVWRRLER
ncbi:MAG: Uma2 family endonuclease [Nitrococcus sp.]|nr:Uma2 family endonuclease [Nitrococcus sp.]